MLSSLPTSVRGQVSLFFILSHSTFPRQNTQPFRIPRSLLQGHRAEGSGGPSSHFPSSIPKSPSLAPAQGSSDRPSPGSRDKAGLGGGFLRSPRPKRRGEAARALRALTRQLVRLQPGIRVQPADDKVVGEATGR